MNPLGPWDWHARFQAQAEWTHDLRAHLFPQADLARARRILEVGAGTGVITGELHELSSARLYGLDLDPVRLALVARPEDPRTRFIAGNALDLPFPSATFEIAYCHFLLLWIADPVQALEEMKRVVRPGGHVLALAEPDYGGRIDYPLELADLGRLQAESLRDQGADPHRGRQLGALFQAAGLLSIEVGILGGYWKVPSPKNWDAEWAILEHDLDGQIPAESLDRWRAVDREAWERGERILFVPTFYAWGQTPIS